MVPPAPIKPELEKLLFCGWRRDLHSLIACLDDFVQPGTQLWLYNNVAVAEREAKLKEAGLDPNLLKNLTLVYRDPTVPPPPPAPNLSTLTSAQCRARSSCGSTMTCQLRSGRQS